MPTSDCRISFRRDPGAPPHAPPDSAPPPHAAPAASSSSAAAPSAAAAPPPPAVERKTCIVFARPATDPETESTGVYYKVSVTTSLIKVNPPPVPLARNAAAYERRPWSQVQADLRERLGQAFVRITYANNGRAALPPLTCSFPRRARRSLPPRARRLPVNDGDTPLSMNYSQDDEIVLYYHVTP